MRLNLDKILNEKNASTKLSRVRFNRFLSAKEGVSPDCFLDEAIQKLGSHIYLKNAEADRILNGLQAIKDLGISQTEKKAAVGAAGREAARHLGRGALTAAGASAVLVPSSIYVGNRLAEESSSQMRNKAIQAGAALAGIDLLRRGATHVGGQAADHFAPITQKAAQAPKPPDPPRPPQPPRPKRIKSPPTTRPPRPPQPPGQR